MTHREERGFPGEQIMFSQALFASSSHIIIIININMVIIIIIIVATIFIMRNSVGLWSAANPIIGKLEL